MVTKTDKGKTVVITDKSLCNQKNETFLQESQFVKINKYPTYVSCKQKNNRLYKNTKL